MGDPEVNLLWVSTFCKNILKCARCKQQRVLVACLRLELIPKARSIRLKHGSVSCLRFRAHCMSDVANLTCKFVSLQGVECCHMGRKRR